MTEQILKSTLVLAALVLPNLSIGQDTNVFYPGYVGALNSTIGNLMSQLKVYQQYIDQAFQPLGQYDKVFKKPLGSFSDPETPEPTHNPTTKASQNPDPKSDTLKPTNPVVIPEVKSDSSAETQAPIVENSEFSDPFDELLSTIYSGSDGDDVPPKPNDESKDLSKPAATTTGRIGVQNSENRTPADVIEPNIKETHKGSKSKVSPDPELPGSISFGDLDSAVPKNPNHLIDNRFEPNKFEATASKPMTTISTCGIFDPSSSRARGHIVWPWMASIGKQYKSGFLYKCGGTVVDSRAIVTSAHCVNAGIDTVDIAGQKIQITGMIIHPSYRATMGYNDIGLVVLSEPISWTTKTSAACLPYTDSLKSGNHLDKADGFSWSSEWRYANVDGGLALKMKNVHTKILNSSFCESEIRGNGADFQEMFPKGLDSTLLCVRSSRGRLCQGDSGVSLLTRDRTGKSYLIGTIVKGEDSCGELKLPSIYTRVSKFSDWIQKEITSLSV